MIAGLKEAMESLTKQPASEVKIRDILAVDTFLDFEIPEMISDELAQLGMIAAGNAVVINPHPHAVNVLNYAVDMINKVVIKAGGPENLVCSVDFAGIYYEENIIDSFVIGNISSHVFPAVSGTVEIKKKMLWA